MITFTFFLFFSDITAGMEEKFFKKRETFFLTFVHVQMQDVNQAHKRI